jgi:hypothetical protein
VLRRHPRVLVLWDEIYEHIWFTAEAPVHLLHVAPDLRERTLLVNGASKTYAMTGWRIGWGAGPKALIDAMVVIQSQASSGPNSMGQAAVAAALVSADQSFVTESRAAYARRAAFVSHAINAIPGLALLHPKAPSSPTSIAARSSAAVGPTASDRLRQRRGRLAARSRRRGRGGWRGLWPVAVLPHLDRRQRCGAGRRGAAHRPRRCARCIGPSRGGAGRMSEGILPGLVAALKPLGLNYAFALDVSERRPHLCAAWASRSSCAC